VNTWRTKYEALAKLYSQLRHEHLELLQKFKQVQLKAASAQEAIDKREKMEREIKTKNLELADMIRERDRAFHEVDRLKGVSIAFRLVSVISLLNKLGRVIKRKLKSLSASYGLLWRKLKTRIALKARNCHLSLRNTIAR
jgi:type II restriction/modification system DNA methylase subunit YeeA